MTMNPHTTATGLRTESEIAARGMDGAPASTKPSITPLSLACAAFILFVTFLAKVFYE